MRCPFCGKDDTQVKDSRASEDGATIRRRRLCTSCGSRFTTFERIQLRDLIVVKTDGQKETFDRDKMYRSLSLALKTPFKVKSRGMVEGQGHNCSWSEVRTHIESASQKTGIS